MTTVWTLVAVDDAGLVAHVETFGSRPTFSIKELVESVPRYSSAYVVEGSVNGGDSVARDWYAPTRVNPLQRIEERLKRAADEVFDPETAVDSDGFDQAERAGILQALEIVQEVLS